MDERIPAWFDAADGRERESDPAPSPQYSGERAGVRGLRLAKLRFITNQELAN
jgi:hypothetical protein